MATHIRFDLTKKVGGLLHDMGIMLHPVLLLNDGIMGSSFFTVKKMMLLVWAICSLMEPVYAMAGQEDYVVKGRRVYYEGIELPDVDASSFVDMGYGYGKDAYNVFYHGHLLPYVDPVTFSLKCSPQQSDEEYHRYGHSRYGTYFQDDFDVYYNGRKIEDATSNSFKDLGYGYAKDAFNVYYRGEEIEDASPSSFVILKDGYAKDDFQVYYFGKIVEDASPSSFTVIGRGYAKDDFNGYYRGRQLSD